MTPDDVRAALQSALTGRRLLEHPFYRRWEAGALLPGELPAYAGQYRYFESELPSLLRQLLAELAAGPAAELVSQNLRDEESNPQPHVALFEQFAAAVDAEAASPTAATTNLLSTYHRLIASGPAAGLAGLTAYEVQSPEIAATKAHGLRAHYGLTAAATRFWDLHATMDRGHAAWAVDALSAVASDLVELSGAIRTAADAWWAFLDEREAEAALIAS